MTDDLNIDRENFFALLTTQALLGNVSPGLHGVAIEVSGERLTFYFLVEAHTSVIVEDIDEIVTDVEGLMLPAQITIEVVVTEEPADWPGRNRRMIFLRREY